MGYRLSLADPVPKTLRVTALEVLDNAAGRARDGLAGDPEETVHEIRKDIKKTRSLLRLARPGLPTEAYRRENRHLRDTARSISGARDADVLAETVDKLAGRYAGRLPKRAFAELRERLAEAASGAGEPADGPALVAALQQARAGVAALPLEGCDRATLRAGAVRAYARGRDALASVEQDPSVERLHEWRKRVKDLWYHQRLLREAWPAALKALADESHRLSDLLGDDHDLAMLADRLAHTPATVHADTLAALIVERRAELQDEARQLGCRVYADKPKAYGRRLARYLAAAGDAPATAGEAH
jgi:CHAD domain-containing protein